MILRFLVLLACSAVVLFGLGCLNYTEASNYAHHLAFAQEYGLPEPTRNIHRLGMATTAIGSFLMGFFLKRR